MAWPKAPVTHPVSGCFDHLFTPSVRKRFLTQGCGDGGTHNTQYLSSEIGNCLLVTYTHSFREEDPMLHSGHLRIALVSRVNSQMLWEAGFIVLREWCLPWFPQNNVIGCFE